MALWPFRKRRKTKTTEGKNSVVQDPPTVERKLSLLRKASTRQNPRRSASRRRAAAATTNAREIPYTSPAPVLDFPLPPGRNSSPTDPMDANFQLDPNFQPQKRSHEGGFSSYFVEIDRPMTSSSTSSARPHKTTSIVRKLSKRGRESKQHSQPPPSAYIQQLARSASKRDGKRMRSFNSFEYDRPMSQSSLPPRQSLSSSLSSVSSMRAYRIRSFELFTPRPRLRYDSGSGTSSDGKHGQISDMTPSRSNSRSNREWRQKSGVEGRSHGRTRVDELADDMDAKELREAMDRDRRRRERKKLQEQERMQRKLERKQMKQREQEQEQMGLGMDMEVDQEAERQFQHNLERNQGMFVTPPKGQVGESSRAAATYGGFSPVRNPYPFPEVDGLGRPISMGTNTPLSWLNDPSTEDFSKSARVSDPRTDMATPVSMDSAEYMSEEPTFDTAKKVNVTSHSHAQISPIHSRSNSKSEKIPKVQVDSPTIHGGFALGKPVELEEVEDEQDSRRGKQSAWTSFIKKATAARIQKEQDSREIQAGQSALVSDSEEDEGLGKVEEPARKDFYDVEQLRHNEGQTPGRHIPDELAFAMTALETGHVRGKDEIEDERRDHFSPTSLTSYQHYGRPSSSKSSLGPTIHRPQNIPKANHAGSSHSHTPELHEDSPTIPAQAPRTSSQQSYPRPSSQRYSPSMHRYSSGAASPEGGPRSVMSTSLASIDSEGSWLSGRMTNPRQSLNQISPLRASATSLRRRYKGLDDGASIDGDDYFSGVEPRRPKNQNGDEEYVYQTRMELSDDSEDDDNVSIGSEAEQKMWREGPGKKVVPQEIATLQKLGTLKGLGRENSQGSTGRGGLPSAVGVSSSRAQSNEEFMTPLEHPYAKTTENLEFLTPMEHPAARKSTVAEIVGVGR